MDEPESLTDDDALADSPEPVHVDFLRLDRSLLRRPVVVRALFGVAIGVAVLVWPERTDRILFRLIGLAFLAVGATRAWAATRRPDGRAAGVLVGLAQCVIGVILAASVVRSAAAPGRLIGATLVAVALVRVLAWRRERGSPAWLAATTVALVATGVVALTYPEEIVSAFTDLVALGWLTLSVAVLVVALDARTPESTTFRGAAQLIGAWLLDRPKAADDRRELYDKILYDGPQARRRLIRFVTLMTFASIIAALGVITDSTAVVVGAMLIAPLMTPLMGMAISLVMGWPNRLAGSALVAGAGIVLAIGIALVLGLILPTVIDTATNSQITSRASPTTLDLLIALAAGTAGAYGLSRRDVSDSLPGVAVAIALVPPLSVVGIALSQRDWSAASGSLLLFATNAVAILIMGGVTFVVTGVTPIRRAAENQHRVRTAVAAVLAAGSLVVLGLLVNGSEITSNLLEQSRAESAVSAWLDDASRYSSVETTVDGDVVRAVVVGPSTGLPDVSDLADDLADDLGRAVTVDVRLIVEEQLTARSS